MICFQDRTFCKDPDCAGECGFTVWTPELAAAAERWWWGEQGTAPVAFIEHDHKRGMPSRRETPLAAPAEPPAGGAASNE